MHWLQDENGKVTLDNLQLDIVGFLAILGEGSVLANAQVSTLSKWFFLPRLIPAPQSLMRPTRPEKLEPESGTVTGIFSGNNVDQINHIGNVVCDASNLEPHSVRVVHIQRRDDRPLKYKTFAPVTWNIFLGFFFSVALLAISIWQDDGMSIVATLLLSFLTTLIAYGNYWDLDLARRRVNGYVPRGDVVIRYPKGSFLVVRCEETVARELYFAPETVSYQISGAPYRILSLIATVMLMGGVICLANAQIQCQVAWAAAYMLLGASYWIVAALPARLHWDTSAYEVTDECLSDSKMDDPKRGFPSYNKTYTQALWKTIVLAKGVDWVHKNRACPETGAWKEWLQQAQYEARKVSTGDMRQAERRQTLNGEWVTTWKVPAWDPQEALKKLLQEEAKKNERAIKEGLIENEVDIKNGLREGIVEV